MKKILVCVLAVMLIAVPGMSLAESVLRVTGNGVVSVKPDIAIIEVGYSGKGAVLAEVQQEVATASAAITAAAEALAIPAEKIQTVSLSVYPTYDYASDGQEKFSGYHVSHIFKITVEDITLLGQTLDAVMSAGANHVGAISYQYSKEKEAYHKALALAVEDASAKADALAVAAGLWLTTLDTVEERSYGAPAVYDMRAMPSTLGVAEKGIGGSVVVGEYEVSATVEVSYKCR